MIERKVKALKDIELNTYYNSYFLVENEVKNVLFKNQTTLNDYLAAGNIILADRDEKEIKPIPVIPSELKDVDNTVLVKVDEQKLPFVEAIQKHVELDEVHESVVKTDDVLQVEEVIEKTTSLEE